MTIQPQHTPLPWKNHNRIDLITDNEEVIGTLKGFSFTDAQDEANAAFIVRACNNHYKLIDLLSDALPFVENAIGDETYKQHKVKALIAEIRDAVELYEAQAKEET